MSATATTKPSFLLDTGPLSVLCSFPIKGTPYIHVVLAYTDLVLAKGIVLESKTGKIARIVAPLLKAGKVLVMTVPSIPIILDISYGRDLGIGERDIIKIALSTQLQPVIDDKDAFIAACRFGLRPIGFQDFIIKLTKEHGLPKVTGVDIVKITAHQYPSMFLAHTLDMLK